MALLQVRDFPAELYALLALVAEKEKRSITQQTIYMLESLLLQSSNGASVKRNNALNKLSEMNLSLPKTAPSAIELIKNDRNGTEKWREDRIEIP